MQLSSLYRGLFDARILNLINKKSPLDKLTDTRFPIIAILINKGHVTRIFEIAQFDLANTGDESAVDGGHSERDSDWCTGIFLECEVAVWLSS